MNKLQELVKGLTFNQMFQIIEDYERFLEAGSIGDCLLRTQAEVLMGELGTKEHVTFWMMDVATECYKHFARKYLENIKESESD